MIRVVGLSFFQHLMINFDFTRLHTAVIGFGVYFSNYPSWFIFFSVKTHWFVGNVEFWVLLGILIFFISRSLIQSKSNTIKFSLSLRFFSWQCLPYQIMCWRTPINDYLLPSSYRAGSMHCSFGCHSSAVLSSLLIMTEWLTVLHLTSHDCIYHLLLVSSAKDYLTGSQVDYDDGDEEILDLWQESWEFIGDELAPDIVCDMWPISKRLISLSTLLYNSRNCRYILKQDLMVDK